MEDEGGPPSMSMDKLPAISTPRKSQEPVAVDQQASLSQGKGSRRASLKDLTALPAPNTASSPIGSFPSLRPEPALPHRAASAAGVGGTPAVLNGVETETKAQTLMYGDSISLIPNGLNACLAFGDAEDKRGWIEFMRENVGMPPNIVDCRFQLIPRRQYVEAKTVSRLVREAKWDDGRNLQPPRLPPGQILPKALTALAQEFAKRHQLSEANREQTQAMFTALLAMRDEVEENESEARRQSGSADVHYGDLVQLVHVSTGSMVSVSKMQALERAEKKVDFVQGGGSERCVFQILPAFKTLSSGEKVSSGDLAVFLTEKKIEGNRYYLHMSNLVPKEGQRGGGGGHGGGQKLSLGVVMRGLQCDSPYIVGGEELNGSIRPTFWRTLLFSSFSAGESTQAACKAEDVISFYHKDAEAYLTFDPAVSQVPVFSTSTRVSSKARKKSGWLWKLENDKVIGAGEQLGFAEDDKDAGSAYYRIKHLATNLYLSRAGGQLAMTADYIQTDEGVQSTTLWSFKSFTKEATGVPRTAKAVSVGSLTYIRAAAGGWISHLEDDKDADGRRKAGASKGPSVAFGKGVPGDDKGLQGAENAMPAVVRDREQPPERDALLILPVRAADKAAVAKLRKARVTLSGYHAQLERLPDCDAGPSVACPEELGAESARLLRTVDESYSAVADTLATLALGCTIDNDTNPFTSDGPPNKIMQKLLREVDLLDLVVSIIAKPFRSGVRVSWVLDPRMSNVKQIAKLSYRLLKQAVKGNEKNAALVVKHVPLFRTHLGGNLSCTATIRELYDGKRRMLAKIEEEQVQEYVTLLKRNRDPRFISFLRAICACDGQPIPANQEKVVRLLLSQDELLPSLAVEVGKEGNMLRAVARLKMPGGDTEEIVMAKYTGSTGRGEAPRADLLIDGMVEKPNQQDKVFLYTMRCLELYVQLALGRNQASLGFLLRTERMQLSYNALLKVMMNEGMPYAVRARSTQLMMRLWVDREPQSSKPQVHYTRAWSRTAASVQATNMDVGTQKLQESLPVCETGFKEVIQALLDLLCPLSQAPGAGAITQLGPGSGTGQIEFVRCLVELVDLMLDFELICPDRNSVDCDYTVVRRIYHGLHCIVDVSNKAEQAQSGSEASKNTVFALGKMRAQALMAMWRCFNIRSNHRISLVVHSWEGIFQEVCQKQEFKNLVQGKLNIQDSIHESEVKRYESLSEFFKPYNARLQKLVTSMFSESIVCPPSIGADVVKQTYSGASERDPTLECLLALLHDESGQGDATVPATRALFRHCLQKTRCMQELKVVQLLAFPSAVKLYNETESDIKRLTALKKHLYADQDEAYEEVEAIIKRLVSYLTEGGELGLTRPIVRQNQTIIFHRELDEAVVNLVMLELTRDSSQREAGLKVLDRAVNERRRDMMQELYYFLTALCKGFRPAQEKLFPLIQMFSDHIGIERLNVADTIAEIFSNNPPLLMQVKSGYISQFVALIVDYGRKPRWLRFFERFLEVNGEPIKRNQDLVLSLLLEEEKSVIDLTGDYSRGHFTVSPKDERNGKTRLDLMRENEHRQIFASLLQYHCTCINLLAMCAAGKNPTAKVLLFPMVPLHVIVFNILSCDRLSDGSRDGVVCPDAVAYVRRPWTKLLGDVYMSSNDGAAVRQLMSSNNVWGDTAALQPAGDQEGVGKAGGRVGAVSGSLMEEFARAIGSLNDRLKDRSQEKGADPYVQFEGVQDPHGADLSCHVRYVHEIVRVLKLLFQRRDLFPHIRDTDSMAEKAQNLRKMCAVLAQTLWRLEVDDTANMIVEMDKEMSKHDVNGPALVRVSGGRTDEAQGMTEEDLFKQGWRYLCEHLTTLALDTNTSNSRTVELKATLELGMMFGSQQTPFNQELKSLRVLLQHLTEPHCDSHVRIVGLRTVRAILYVQPDNPSVTAEMREKELERYLLGDPPLHIEQDPDYARDLQAQIAQLGGVQAVLYNLDAQRLGFQQESDSVLAALRLASAMLENGNKKVQDLFAASLKLTSSQGFFMLMRNLIETSIEGVRQRRKKMKQAEADLAAQGGKAGDASTYASMAKQDSGGGSGGEEDGKDSKGVFVYSLEVVRLMQLLCMGQHRPLQNILRRQRLNRESVDLFSLYVDYLKALEPAVKWSLDRDQSQVPKNMVTVQAIMMRGFDMLASAMQGPNRENQESFSTIGLFDLADLVMAKIKLADSHGIFSNPKHVLAKRKREEVSKAIKDNPHGSLKEHKRKVFPALFSEKELVCNGERSRLKASVLSCLLAFLEGIQDDVVADQMKLTLHWGNMTLQMISCHQYRNSPQIISRVDADREGIMYFFLMRFIKNYDLDNSVIDPIFRQNANVVKYYADRTGYVEIVRDEVLERVYFRLPENCLPGRALDKPFAEMYDTDREEPDRKCREFLQNMCDLVEVELFHAKIRETWLRFTVNGWNAIRQATFAIALLIHFILVTGGYVPKTARGEDSVFGERRRQRPTTTTDDVEVVVEEGGENTIWETWFFENIHPVTLVLARALCLVYLVACVLRAFAYLWAQCPLYFLGDASGGGGGIDEEGEEEDAGDEGDGDAADPIHLLVGGKRRDSAFDVEKELQGLQDADEQDWGEEQDEEKDGAWGWWSMTKEIVQQAMFWYEFLFFSAAVLSVALDEPMLTVYGLFEICFWSGSKTAIDAIRFNMGKMLQTMLLGLLAMYLWMCVGISTLREQHDGNCNNMFQCFSAYLYKAIRGDGVVEVLDGGVTGQFPTNIMDAFDPRWQNGWPFVWRVVWDVSYWLLFVLILIAIISGIIIDAFSGMRDEVDAKADDIRTNCFVCNLDRFKLDQQGIGFDRHVAVEHNPRFYLYFLLCIRNKRVTDLTGQESYVRRCVWPQLDYSWIPRGRTMTLRADEEDSEMSTMLSRMGSLEEKVWSMDQTMAKVMQAVTSVQESLDRRV